MPARLELLYDTEAALRLLDVELRALTEGSGVSSDADPHASSVWDALAADLPISPDVDGKSPDSAFATVDDHRWAIHSALLLADAEAFQV